LDEVKILTFILMEEGKGMIRITKAKIGKLKIEKNTSQMPVTEIV